MKYAFILGRNGRLSAAEIKAVLPEAVVLFENDVFVVLENEVLDAGALMNRLGGTIKIAEVMSNAIEKQTMVDFLVGAKKENKLNFGVSFYGVPKTNIGMDVKTALKNQGISCRLVVGKEKALSSVIVTKNRVVEFLNLNGTFLARTVAVQDFEEYSDRDFGRPARDMKSGSMPPKLAKIMLNLSQAKNSDVILDPFCGSGTMLTEAMLLGFQYVIGTDISAKAISDTEKNIAWLRQRGFKSTGTVRVEVCDVAKVSTKVAQADAVVTEPYLGPPLRGGESPQQIEKIVAELRSLYLDAFSELKKVLSEHGRVVMVFPSWKTSATITHLGIEQKIEQMGFVREDDNTLIYSRPDQKVFRNVRVFRKQ